MNIPENAFRVDQAKQALQTAISDGIAVVVSRDKGFLVVMTRHAVTREVNGDGWLLDDETRDGG